MVRTGILLLILLLIAVLSGWLNRHESQSSQATADNTRQSDFFLEDFVIHQFDTDGILKYQVRGDRLTHFPDDDSTLIKLPVINMQASEKPAWRIQANNALASNETLDELWLEGEISIQQHSQGITHTELRTDRLLLKPQSEWVETESRVTLLQPQATIVATGLTANLATGRIELSQVKGRYVPK